MMVVALGLLILAGRESAHVASGSPGFVTANGSDLELDGQPYRFTGLNIYNANSNGWCWYEMATGNEMDDALTSIGPGKKVIRSWFFQPMATDGGVRNWSRFDNTLSVAAAHGYRVVVTLTDQWGECGAVGDQGQLSYHKTADWYTTGYMSPDPGMLSSYRDWVAEVVNRYKDNPTVLMWELINEAEVKESLQSGCLPGSGSFEILYGWAEDVSRLVKSIDPNHLVTLGAQPGHCGAIGTQYQEYQDLHGIPAIDVCTAHDYMYGAAMPGHIQAGIDLCTAINKPIFIGEVGMSPNQLPGGQLIDRAEVIAAKRDAQVPAGIDGILAWAWSNLGSTLDRTDIGPGDPALEALILDDNCPGFGNPNQENADGDPWGNACDNCPTVSNVAQTNTDDDPYGDACDNCPAWPNPAQNLPSWPVPASDPDCDGFTTTAESHVGTDPNLACGINAWPVDINSDHFSDITDISTLAGNFGKAVPSAPVRQDIAPEPAGDGFVDIADIAKLAGFFGRGCTP